MTRREFLGALAAGPAAALAQQRQPVKPNIIFILADDLGYGDLGCYGQERIRTPNLDRLAAEGVRFTQAYSGSTVCAPSRCVLMTGKHTGHSTVRGNRSPEVPLRPDEANVGSVLKAAGYRAAVFGKWGLGGPHTDSTPDQRGFEEFFGFMNHRHAHLSYPEHLWENRQEHFLVENWFDRRKLFAPDLFTQRALSFVERQDRDPFFLYLACTIPHANNELGAIQPNGMEVPDQGVYARERWPDVEKNFAAAITRLDSDIGRLLELVRKKGFNENTLIIFTSDNGAHREGGHDPNFFRSSGPLRGIKRDLYEGGIRVPAIARWTGTIRPGRTSEYPWAFWDVLPTAAELAGVRPPPGLDGISIVPILQGGAPPPREHFYWEFHERGFHQAVRQGDWKLVRQGPRFELELFNLRDDLGETRDLAKENPQIVARLEKLLHTSRVESPEWPLSRP
jgi:arylsulfatase A-like enzyme